jgi:hypothetical protein
MIERMGLIDDPRLTPDEQRLRDGISDISERCRNAGWEHEAEFEVWRLAVEGGRWGRHSADELHPELGALVTRARRLDRWIAWRPEPNSEHDGVDLHEWERRYAHWRSGRR